MLLSHFVACSGGVIWQRLDPLSGSARDIATLPAMPQPTDLQVSPNGEEALVTLRERGQRARVARIRIADGSMEILGGVAVEHDGILGATYAADNTPLLFVGDKESLEQRELPDGGVAFVHEGELFPFHPQLEETGQLRVLLAQVYELHSDGPRRIERRVIAQAGPTDYQGLESKARIARGLDATDARKVEQRLVADAAWKKAWGMGDEYWSWFEVQWGNRKVRYLAYDFGRLALPIVVETDHGFAKLEGLDHYEPPSAWLVAWLQGDYVLVVNYHGKSGMLYDLRSGERVWAATGNALCAFWPGHALT